MTGKSYGPTEMIIRGLPAGSHPGDLPGVPAGAQGWIMDLKVVCRRGFRGRGALPARAPPSSEP